MCCARSIFSRPMARIEPASMPASEATTTQRVPPTTPMPVMTPAPAMHLAGSGWSRPKPASADSSSHQLPGSSTSAMRSRGSSWPRLSNSGLDCAERSRVRCSSARTSDNKRSMCSRLVAKASPCGLIDESNTGMASGRSGGWLVSMSDAAGGSGCARSRRWQQALRIGAAAGRWPRGALCRRRRAGNCEASKALAGRPRWQPSVCGPQAYLESAFGHWNRPGCFSEKRRNASCA